MNSISGENYTKTIIGEQNVSDNGKIINANTVNSNYFDTPLEFFCEEKIKEHNGEEKFINIKNVLYNILNREGLKRRFGGERYKYKMLLDYFDNESQSMDKQLLDDGYVSIIKCIYEVASRFYFYNGKMYINHENQICKMIEVKVTNEGLMLYYTEEVCEYNTYFQLQSIAKKIVQECEPFIKCAAQYGNFFQFSYMGIKPIENVPFIEQEVHFKVSNNIIPNLIKPLYGNNPECGLREIIQNAMDAIKEYSKNVNPQFDKIYIEVHLIERNKRKKIIVRDYGIGMNREILLEKYFVIGESTKKNSALNFVGQFGIGSLAAFLLGDKIEVVTKHYEEELKYQFSYNLPERELEKTENNNICISICKPDNFLHGTEITIELNEGLSKLNERELRRKLKLDEWYVMTDCPIHFSCNNHDTKLESYKDKSFKWVRLDSDQQDVMAEYCKEYPEEAKGVSQAQIIYNGLMIPERYSLSCKYIDFLPCISINATNQQIKLNLERTKIESGLEPICRNLKKEILNLGIADLKEQKLKILDTDGRILRFTYSNKYLKNMPLFFTREGFGIYSTKSVESLQNDNPNLNIVEVYGILENVKIGDLDQDAIYLFYNMSVDKSLASDLIEKDDGGKYISKKIINAFFTCGYNRYHGLRKKSMYKIYNNLEIKIESNLKVEKLWDWHNENKQVIKNKIEQHEYISIDKEDCNHFQNIMQKYKPDFIWSYRKMGVFSDRRIDENVDIGVINVK